MPNRILHERICVSETLAEVSAEEERLFYRLLVQCDDYGRFDGRTSVIRARCFALQLDRITDEDVRGWLGGLIGVGLLRRYQASGRAYLQVTTWDQYQQIRAKNSKYPDPPNGLQHGLHASDSNRNQTLADVPVFVSGSGNRESISGDDIREASNHPPNPPPQAEGESDAEHDNGSKPKRRRRRGEISTDPQDFLTGEYGRIAAERMAARSAGGDE